MKILQVLFLLNVYKVDILGTEVLLWAQHCLTMNSKTQLYAVELYWCLLSVGASKRRNISLVYNLYFTIVAFRFPGNNIKWHHQQTIFSQPQPNHSLLPVVLGFLDSPVLLSVLFTTNTKHAPTLKQTSTRTQWHQMVSLCFPTELQSEMLQPCVHFFPKWTKEGFFSMKSKTCLVCLSGSLFLGLLQCHS